MSNEMKIAISGKSGCGNSTVSHLVAEKLDLDLINYTFKSMADEMGLSFREVCDLAEEDSKYDKHLDDTQMALAGKARRCVLGSRLSIWLLRDATVKVYLFASPEIRARRIAEREGTDPAETMTDMQERDRRDARRYLKLYRIDIDKYDFVDLVIDTDRMDQFTIADTIVNFCSK